MRIQDNPILAAFRERFVRNPEVNTLTPFGFFEAGWRARDTQVMMLREALIAIADAAPNQPSRGQYVGRAGAFIHSLQATASMALGRPKIPASPPFSDALPQPIEQPR